MNQVRYRTLSPSADTVRQLRDLLASGRSAELVVCAEILEIAAHGRALLWVHGSSDRRSRLGSCRLTPAQLAEAYLAFASGQRPAFEITWDVLGERQSGTFGAVTSPGQARCVSLPPQTDTVCLDDFLTT